jgi:twitching motility two-component system response regulator PilH
MKILLAEDDPSIQIIARLTLQKVGGHEVVVVADGEVAVQFAQTQHFDLIILDGMMPVMGGFEAARALKALEATKHIPIIFMSAKNQSNDVDEGLRLGAIGYIVKPFDANDLVSEIQKIYNKYLFQRTG